MHKTSKCRETALPFFMLLSFDFNPTKIRTKRKFHYPSRFSLHHFGTSVAFNGASELGLHIKIIYFLNLAASSDPLVALPSVYACAPAPANFPPCAIKYSLRIGLFSK